MRSMSMGSAGGPRYMAVYVNESVLLQRLRDTVVVVVGRTSGGCGKVTQVRHLRDVLGMTAR